MKDSVEVINFHINSRGVQGLVFVQIKFEKCTTNFYSEIDKVSVKMVTSNLEPLLAWNVSHV